MLNHENQKNISNKITEQERFKAFSRTARACAAHFDVQLFLLFRDVSKENAADKRYGDEFFFKKYKIGTVKKVKYVLTTSINVTLLFVLKV